MRIDACCILGTDREYDLDAAALLKAMDAAHVDKAVISPVDRCLAVHNREGNALMCAAAAAHADRFIPTCTANPWYGKPAVEEIRNAAAEGAAMLVLHPQIQGFGFGDDLANPLLETAASLKLPVYVHTGGYHFGTPAQLGMAAAKYPQITFIMGHSGTTDFRGDAIEIAGIHPNVLAETSLTRPFGALDIVRSLGDGRALMGSAAPLNDLPFEWRETARLLPPEDHPGFYGETIAALLSGGTP